MPSHVHSAIITGFGCVSPLGLDKAETDLSLRESRDGISPVRLFSVEGTQSKTAGQVSADLGSRAASISPRARRWSRAAQMVLCAMEDALRDQRDFRPERIVVGTTSGGMTLGEDFLRAALSRQGEISTARRLHAYVPNQPILQSCRALGIDAPVRIVSNACASGTNALGVGLHLIRSGQARRVLVGGYDSIAELVFAGFDCLRASTAEKCRPFDASRTGLCLGEGAAFFRLEAGAEGDIALTGYGSAFDAHHLTQPHPSGRGPRVAMERALLQAGLPASAVDYVNAHGTGTALNDSSEGLAIREVCPQAAVSSTKGMTGHSLGAAGAIEAAFCCLALQGGYLPANINFQSGDDSTPANLVANTARLAAARTALSNSFGFGGSNASIVIQRPS